MSAFKLEDCEEKVRVILNDTLKSERQINIYEASDIFTLEEENPTAVTAVFKNDAEQSSSDWAYDSDTGKLTISFSALSGDVIEIQYSCYEKYSSTEIINFIKRALVEISINKYADFEIDDDDEIVYYDEDLASGVAAATPDFYVQNLIAAIAAILIKPENKSYKLPDLQVIVASSKPTYLIIRDIISKFKKNRDGIIDILPEIDEDV